MKAIHERPLVVNSRVYVVLKNIKSNNQYFFPQTKNSRFDFLPHRHFHYLSLWYSLSLIRALANIRASVQDKPCELQEQRIMAQIALHPQLMSNTNASRLVVHPVNRQHIFLPSLLFKWNIDWEVRFQTAAWKYVLCVYCRW